MADNIVTARAWELILSEETAIRRLLYTVATKAVGAARAQQAVEEMWTEVVLPRIIRISELYKPNHESTASFKTFALRNIWGYAAKHMVAKAKRSMVAFEPFMLGHYHSFSEVDDKDLVNTLLSQIPKRSAAILILRHTKGLTFEELGLRLRCESGTALYHYRQALKDAQEWLRNQDLMTDEPT